VTSSSGFPQRWLKVCPYGQKGKYFSNKASTVKMGLPGGGLIDIKNL